MSSPPFPRLYREPDKANILPCGVKDKACQSQQTFSRVEDPFVIPQKLFAWNREFLHACPNAVQETGLILLDPGSS